MEGLHGEGNAVVQSLLVRRDRRHLFVDAGDLDLALRVDEAAQYTDEVRHGLLRGAAEDAAMQVGAGAGNLHAVVVAAAKAVRQARLLGAQPIVIADADGIGVGEVALALLLDQLLETLGSVFLHALEAHEQVDGEVDAGLLVGFDGVQPAEHGALVVGATTAKHAAIVANGQGEGLGRPAIGLLGGLDVVVAVHQDSSLVLVVTIASKHDGGKLEIGLIWLLPKRAQLDAGA